MSKETLRDGIHGMVPRAEMSEAARRHRDFYEMKPGASIIQREFGFYSLERWIAEGHIRQDTNIHEIFGFEENGIERLGDLGWTEAEFYPRFESKWVEDRGDHEVILDEAGRHVLYFKGRRSGFMPEYLEHPVKDWKTWKEDCKWRLDPTTPGRFAAIEQSLPIAKAGAAQGKIVQQGLIGGYMYLRSLIGPLELLYKFYDEPKLIHDCMKTWFELADAIIAKRQEALTIDEIFFGEDICYNHGSLISPEMMREFLLPYYQQLITNLRKRQIDKNRHLYIQVDTDGFCDPVISIYKEIGMDIMSPFEVASGCDVVRTGKEYPELRMTGGFDKRIIAESKDAIDREIERILPLMKARGGYIPTCDHGVPEEVSFENYVHFRNRLKEFV
ncbi:MAG: uroporphyrinogen decarboxylase family protein [Clostridia bacterium]